MGVRQKRNIVRYKDRLIAQEVSQKPEIYYNEMYSPVINIITFRFLIIMIVFKKLEIRFIYSLLNSYIHIKILFKMLEAYTPVDYSQ